MLTAFATYLGKFVSLLQSQQLALQQARSLKRQKRRKIARQQNNQIDKGGI